MVKKKEKNIIRKQQTKKLTKMPSNDLNINGEM